MKTKGAYSIKKKNYWSPIKNSNHLETAVQYWKNNFNETKVSYVHKNRTINKKLNTLMNLLLETSENR